LGATLALLQAKGFLDDVTEEQKEKDRKQKEIARWLMDQKLKDLEREREREKDGKGGRPRKDDRRDDRERMERDRDAIKRFENYQPVVDLKYTDTYGRNLDPKEAFRLLSHKFHGKGPGKKKTEKDLKRIEADIKREKGDEEFFQSSVQSLEQRQKALGQAGIVIQKGSNTQ